jgi:hypothetical protein
MPKIDEIPGLLMRIMVEVCKKSHFNSIFKANILDFGGFGNKI